jgi:YhcN/YlaJ family sporulation lipoprotein
MSKKTSWIVLALVLVVAMAFTGCTTARKPMNTPVENKIGYNKGDTNPKNSDYPQNGDNWEIRNWRTDYTTDMYHTNMGTNQGNVTGTNPGSNMNTTTAKSDDIAKACESVEGVQNAMVVVTGNTAYVGIDTDRNTVVANERDIKKNVAQAVRATGSNVNTVYVSTDMKFMDRLRSVGAGLRNGRPVDEFTTDLKNMVQSVTPENW